MIKIYTSEDQLPKTQSQLLLYLIKFDECVNEIDWP